MSEIKILPAETYGLDFISGSYLPEGKDEFYLRNTQGDNPRRKWRNLTQNEIGILEKNRNRCSNWNLIKVEDPFNPELISDSFFHGLVRIGATSSNLLKYHDFTLPEGISFSRIISCDIGSHCAIHNCRYISHYIIGDYVILSSINEMETTNHSKFGNGIVKEGEEESVRIWIEPINEAGGRQVLPFETMTTGDAYLWAIYRDDKKLTDNLLRITQNSFDTRRGWYGTIGSNSVIKGCGVIKDTKIGNSCYIKGANKLKNLTIKSDETEMTQIGEGVELVNGIIGYGCRIFYGCKAIRFVMGNNSSLKYGARLIHSILGDNSTISCCEVLNNLVFPYHEQHHNNSFLIATMIMGQSNMAAGATVGSNHNSRGNDGEIIAGRGFWPGLSSTLKHNCKFASHLLITKGNYPAELYVPFPFAMLIDNTSTHQREVMPAYYWMYNMYALERNSWKFSVRDKRVHKEQFIETAYLAPDTVQEIIKALDILEGLTGAYYLEKKGDSQALQDFDPWNIPEKLKALGRKILDAPDSYPDFMEFVRGGLYCNFIERSKQSVKILKIPESRKAYLQMLTYYGVTTLCDYCKKDIPVGKFAEENAGKSSGDWVNMGGQLVPSVEVDRLRKEIGEDKFKTWDEIHKIYKEWETRYPFEKAVNALNVLVYLNGGSDLEKNTWDSFKTKVGEIRNYIEEQVYKTKKKDYTNKFRGITYRNPEERDAVLGKVEDNSFIKGTREESLKIREKLNKAVW